MLKMPDTGRDHSYVVLVAVVDAILITNRAAGLYHRRNTRLTRNFDAIGEREKCIGSHNGPVQIKSK